MCKEKELYKYERKLLDCAADELSEIDGIELYYDGGANVQSGVLSFNVHGKGAEDVAYELSQRNIATRAGLHCAPLAHETVGDMHGTVRISFSAFNTEKDIEELLRALFEIKK